MVGSDIRATRRQYRLSQRALGEAFGVRRETIRNWENDAVEPAPEHAERIEALLAGKLIPMDLPSGPRLVPSDDVVSAIQGAADSDVWEVLGSDRCQVLYEASRDVWVVTRPGADASSPLVAVDGSRVRALVALERPAHRVEVERLREATSDDRIAAALESIAESLKKLAEGR